MKRAVCVGVDDYPVKGADLHGCVNDAKAWAAVLHEHFDVPAADITLLADRRATKSAILGAIDALLAGAGPGDVLVATFSSHGTYVADADGDESSYDEAICPWDMKRNLIVDDELRVRFAAVPAGVSLTVIGDSCFSGSSTRGPVVPTPDDRRHRFVNPKLIGRREIAGVRQTAKPSSAGRHLEADMREVLLSGCRDDQYSFDARFGATYHGAMSYFALDILRRNRYRLTYEELHSELVPRLEHEGFDQEPQLEGEASAKRRPMFT